MKAELIAPLGDLLTRHATHRPRSLAFRDKTRSVDYAALAQRTAAIAIHLEALGVGPGQRVAIHQPNSVDWVEACLGIVRAGAVAVPISAEATDEEIAYRLTDANCVAVFCRPDRMAALDGIIAGTGVRTRCIAQHDGACAAFDDAPAGAQPRDPADLKAPAFIVYTSGTTGKAKGVLLSLHGMLWVTAACWAPIVGLSQDDYVLNSLPLYHSYALNLCVVSIVAAGASEYIMEHFSTSKVAEVVAAEPITVLPGVPTVFHYMLHRAKEESNRVMHKVRLCISAGAVMPGPLNKDFEDWFGVTLVDGYGITETSTMVTLNTPGASRVMGSCGLAVRGLQTRIVDLHGQDVPVGAEGELIVRGPNVMLGYHDKPEETDKVLRQGWYHTGDLARSDDLGFLTITGRLKEVIIRGGQNISPAEVEEAVFSHPAILDCAVVGVPHDFLGEVPAAFVIVRPGEELGAEDVLAHCRIHLSAYKVPHSVHFVESIPRTGSGKVQRFKLRDAAKST